jgi:hypothetical protein
MQTSAGSHDEGKEIRHGDHERAIALTDREGAVRERELLIA